MITRRLASVIQEQATGFKVVAITGPRQSGKTTLVRTLFSRMPYENLEHPQTRQFAIDDPAGFLAQFPNGAVLDEIQRVPELMSWLQGIVDENDAKFVLTGSNNFLLSEQVSQSLAGRAAILHLLPFDQSELDRLGPLEQRLFAGMYPPVVANGLDPALWYQSYLATYVERDVRLIKQITDLDAFQRFVGLLAGRTAQQLNLSAVASDAGISQPTARSWLGVLEASFLVFRLSPHYKNYRKRIVKTPKIYFYDTGLVCALLGIGSADELVRHSMRGVLFETYCVAELVKAGLHRNLNKHFYYWRDKTGHEIDLIDDGEPPKFLEIKSGMTIAADAFKNLRFLRKQAGEDAPRMYLTYAGRQRQQRTDVTVVPWSALLDEMIT